MKNLLKITCIGLLVTGSLTAQSFVDKTKTTKLSVVENEYGQESLVKTITEERHLNVFEADDWAKLNQDIAATPTYVEKTILVDVGNDSDYDKEANISFIKEQNEDEYYLTSEEIVSELDSDEMDEPMIMFEDIE